MNAPMTEGRAAPVGINAIARGGCDDARHWIRFSTGRTQAAWTLAELDVRAQRVAHRLHAMGLRARDRIGVLARNRIEWVLLDLAIIKLGGVTAGFEAGRFEPHQIIQAYGLSALFIDDGDQVGASAGPVHDIGAVLAWSDGPALVDAPPLHDGYDPAEILAIKFTSGSTGVPKGLEATAASVDASLAAVQEMYAHGDGDNLLVMLRLALLQQRYWIYSALLNGHDITLSDVDHAVESARATSPTVVMGVPGFYESLRSQLLASDLPGEGAGEGHGDGAAAARGRAIQAALGGRIRYLWTGSAPCSRAVLSFFNEAGVPLFEGYGLNETCIVAKNHPGAFRLGSVGRVVPGKTVRFDRDGILIVGSRHPVNCRYTWCGEGVNEKTFLPSGEVKTWDLGHVDADGFLYIHGRADDVLTLSSGRNVLVRLIEERLKELPGVHECVLAGNGRPYLTAIVSPARAAPDPAALGQQLQALNAALLPEQRVLAAIVAREPFSVDNGQLTSQFKPRRKDIHQRHAATLERLHAATGVVEPAGGWPVRVVAEAARPGHDLPETTS